jgi:hypothetical protein
MKIFASIGLITVAVLLSIATFSYAKFTIDPSLTVREEYNDNIFLVQTGEEDDFITIISPNITLEYSPNTSLDFSLAYGLDFRFYSNNSDLNDTSLKDTQHADFRAQARPFHHVFIDVTDYYRRIPIDVRDRVVPDNFHENITESNTFIISPYADLPLTSTLSMRIGYSFTNEWYADDSGNNSDSHSAFLSFDKKFPVGLNTSIGYTYLAYRPELSDDYDKHEGSVSAEYQLASNLRVWGGAGIAFLDFANRSNEDESVWDVGIEHGLENFGGTTLSAVYSESLSETDPGDISYFETTDSNGTSLFQERDSLTTGVMKIKRFDFILSANRHVDITINPYYTENEELESDRIDEITGVEVTFQKPLTTKLTAELNGYWETQEFSPENEEVDQYSLGSSIEYFLSRSITTAFGYRFNKRNSNVPGDDYDNNIAWVEAKLTF